MRTNSSMTRPSSTSPPSAERGPHFGTAPRPDLSGADHHTTPDSVAASQADDDYHEDDWDHGTFHPLDESADTTALVNLPELDERPDEAYPGRTYPDEPDDLTTAIPRHRDDEVDEIDEPDRDDDATDETEDRRVSIAGYHVRVWQLVAVGITACVVIVVATILGAASGHRDDLPTPTPQPSAQSDTDSAEEATAHGDPANSRSTPAPADAPLTDPAHDPALSDPPPPGPAPKPASVPAAAPVLPATPPSAAVPQGPLPPNQLPGGPPLPYDNTNLAPNYPPSGPNSALGRPQPNQYSPSWDADTPVAPRQSYESQPYEPRRYDSRPYNRRHPERDTITNRLGTFTGLDRDRDNANDYGDRYRPDDRYGSDDRYAPYDRTRDNNDEGYDPESRDSFDSRRYRGGSDDSLGGALGLN